MDGMKVHVYVLTVVECIWLLDRGHGQLNDDGLKRVSWRDTVKICSSIPHFFENSLVDRLSSFVSGHQLLQN